MSRCGSVVHLFFLLPPLTIACSSVSFHCLCLGPSILFCLLGLQDLNDLCFFLFSFLIYYFILFFFLFVLSSHTSNSMNVKLGVTEKTLLQMIGIAVMLFFSFFTCSFFFGNESNLLLLVVQLLFSCILLLMLIWQCSILYRHL